MTESSINLEELPVEQLQAIRQQLEEEIQVFTNSFTKLKSVQSKFNNCLESLLLLQKDQELLVPLTNSCYVKGNLLEDKKVIIDVGTGYFIEKSVQESQIYYKKKLEYLGKNLHAIQENTKQKQNQKNIVINVLQQKITASA